MNPRTLLCVVALALYFAQAVAATPYQQALAGLEPSALRFVQAPGHTVVEPEALTGDHYYSKSNFPGIQNAQQSISAPDADLDPITRSILLLEAKEGHLPHVRYRVTYSMHASTEVPEAQLDHVEVTRYNLGPTLRDALLASVPGGQVADPAQFGVGPHVSWRFVMAPVMGIRADLMHAGRKEVSDAQARTGNCLGEPCLSLTDPSGPALAWESIPAVQMDQPTYVAKSPSEIAQPARVIQELWASITSDGMDALPYSGDQPQFVFVVSKDVAGQEAIIAGLARQAQVMDHAVAEIWTQRNEVAQVPAEFSRTHVPRR